MRLSFDHFPGQDIMTIEAGQPIPKATFQIKTDEGIDAHETSRVFRHWPHRDVCIARRLHIDMFGQASS